MKTIVERRVYLFGVPMVSGPVKFSGRWKTVIFDGALHLEFETDQGEWVHEHDLFVHEREEYINGVAK